MKADTFMNAVGLISDRHLDIEMPKKVIVHRKWRKRIAAIAASAALIFGPLPTLTAFGVEPAYDILYHVAPSVAQTFKPVQKTCEDNGIEMTAVEMKQACILPCTIQRVPALMVNGIFMTVTGSMFLVI